MHEFTGQNKNGTIYMFGLICAAFSLYTLPYSCAKFKVSVLIKEKIDTVRSSLLAMFHFV